MPIRTEHGRGAVARQAFTWPLRSRRHLVITAAAIAAAVWGGSTAVGALAGDHPASDRPAEIAAPSWTPPPTSTYTIDAPTAPPSTPRVPADTPPIAPSRTASLDEKPVSKDPATAAAYAFVSQWVRPKAGTPSDEWRAAVARHVVPEMMQALASVDPDNVPATKVTGRPKKISQDGPHASVAVPTDAGTVRVVVLRQDDGRWLVSEWSPEGD